MEMLAACEVARLPEEILSAVISLAAPRDTYRGAAVSRDFRAAADSDTVRSGFLPGPRPPAARRWRALPCAAVQEGALPSLLRPPRLLPDRFMCTWLDRESGRPAPSACRRGR